MRIGKPIYNWDKWRLPIDTVVIHHSSSSPTISEIEISAVHLLNLYIKQFMTDEDVKNTAIYSGHYPPGANTDTKNMTFASYHYLIRPNGKVIELNHKSAFLWHAGNLDINRRSVGIVFAGKFTGNKRPTEKAIESFKKLKSQEFKNIEAERIFGHCEVIKKEILGTTECPGESLAMWKKYLLS